MFSRIMQNFYFLPTMKFKLTATQLIVISLILFLITNIFIWTSIQRRISYHKQSLFELEQVRAINRLNQVEDRLLALVNISKKNVLFLANLIEIDMANNVETYVKAQQLKSFLDVNRNYFEARLIDASGSEIIKAERIGDSVLISSSDSLQFKGNRHYFKEALKLSKGNVFVSRMDLNEEHGKVEKPYRPTVRFFSPVFEAGRKTRIIGLNLNLKSWFTIFKDTNIGILNSQNEVYFNTENILYKKFESNLDQKDIHGYPLFFSKILGLENNLEWTLFTRTSNASLGAKLEQFKKDAYKTGASVAVGVLFFLLIAQILFVKNRNILKLNRAIEIRLSERDILIKEIHHRVKNNLQVVASLLSLQSSFIKDEQTKMLFRYSQYRINSMGIVHEMLYKSNDLNRIDYGAYIRELIKTLIQSMKGDKSKIGLVTEVKNIFLNIDTSIPLGLMVNEIITNSLKYGFSDSEEGTITVQMKKLSTFTYELKIGDNGSGIPSHVNFRNTKSLGLKLIHKLALQLRGNIEMDNSKTGTNYIITFQEIEQTS